MVFDCTKMSSFPFLSLLSMTETLFLLVYYPFCVIDYNGDLSLSSTSLVTQYITYCSSYRKNRHL